MPRSIYLGAILAVLAVCAIEKAPRVSAEASPKPGAGNPEFTADGKLVEVDKAVFDAANKQKVNNKEILQWMSNPSKNENEI